MPKICRCEKMLPPKFTQAVQKASVEDELRVREAVPIPMRHAG